MGSGCISLKTSEMRSLLIFLLFMTITRSNPISAVILVNCIFGYFLFPGYLFTECCHLVLVCTWM